MGEKIKNIEIKDLYSTNNKLKNKEHFIIIQTTSNILIFYKNVFIKILEKITEKQKFFKVKNNIL